MTTPTTSNISNDLEARIEKLLLCQKMIDFGGEGWEKYIDQLADARLAVSVYFKQEGRKAAAQAFDYALNLLKDNPEHAVAWIWRQREQLTKRSERK